MDQSLDKEEEEELQNTRTLESNDNKPDRKDAKQLDCKDKKSKSRNDDSTQHYIGRTQSINIIDDILSEIIKKSVKQSKVRKQNLRTKRQEGQTSKELENSGRNDESKGMEEVIDNKQKIFFFAH